MLAKCVTQNLSRPELTCSCTFITCCPQFQRNYLACVRHHKAALMTQRGFWNSLLRDNISFKDLQVRPPGVRGLPSS